MNPKVFSKRLLCIILLAGFNTANAAFDSGSDGTDGELSFSCEDNVPVLWDPRNPANQGGAIDPEGDNIFHFTSINIPANCEIRLKATLLGYSPVIWLSQGDVTINGIVNLDGENGHASTAGSQRNLSIPGPGGFPGGIGATASISGATDGFGPGAGTVLDYPHASHSTTRNASIPRYGNVFLQPLIGGSGGSGNPGGGGGGAGGGALLISSNTLVDLSNGKLYARGGTGSSGDGSGGAVRIVTPRIVMNSSGDVDINTNSLRFGGDGRVRIEAVEYINAPNILGNVKTATLAVESLDVSGYSYVVPTVRITKVNNVDAPLNPTANIPSVDITFNTATTGPVLIQGENMESMSDNLADIEITLEVHNENTGTQTYTATSALIPDQSDATLSSLAITDVTFDPGFSQLIVRAKLVPQEQ